MRPARGNEGLGVLGIDAAFDGVAAKVHGPGGVVELFARGDANLGLDQVHAGDHLGDGMLDLDARVHLDEVEGAVFVHQEFDGAGVGVADFLQRLDDLAAQFASAAAWDRREKATPPPVSDGGAGCCIRARPDASRLPCLSPSTWNSMWRGRSMKLLEIDVGNAEGLLGFVARGFPGGKQFVAAAHHAHAASAAAGGSLDDQRITDARGFGGGRFGIARRCRRCRELRPRPRRPSRAAPDLFRPSAQHLGDGPMKVMSEASQTSAKLAFSERKAVAGMNGVHVGDLGGADHLGDVQVAFGAARRADAHRLVGKAHMQRVAIRLGIDGDGGDAQFLAGADDAQGDFAAVGNQDFAKHRLVSDH
jgi:hypothetical protein